MNFLSHFYFERDNHDPNMVIGVVLPDFVKNAQKDSNLYPLKEKHLFESVANENSILKGWGRHIAVDAVFHSSEFFKSNTTSLKQIILPVLENSPVKPFFLAHIGLELVLDHLLTIHGMVNINTFYEQLSEADTKALDSFLKKSGVADTTIFFKFLNSFISSRYLFSYQKIENISYALNRICMRLWDGPFTEPQLALLTEKLSIFKTNLEENYMSIFNNIELHLNSGNH
ncbi:ACP phosphodiesterase [Pedobacter steynii]